MTTRPRRPKSKSDGAIVKRGALARTANGTGSAKTANGTTANGNRAGENRKTARHRGNSRREADAGHSARDTEFRGHALGDYCRVAACSIRVGRWTRRNYHVDYVGQPVRLLP